MNILIAGANGTTGRQLVEKLSETKEHRVYGMIRKEEQVQTIRELGGEPILKDLEKDVTDAVKNMDAVIFAAGSGPKTGPDKTIAVDRDGAIKLIDAAKKHGVKRFVILSSIGADNPEIGGDSMKHYLEAKHDADEHLIESGLTYTIIRPVALINDAGTGKIKADAKVDHEGTSIPRADVAEVLAQTVTEENTYNKIIEIHSGDTKVEDALKAI